MTKAEISIIMFLAMFCVIIIGIMSHLKMISTAVQAIATIIVVIAQIVYGLIRIRRINE